MNVPDVSAKHTAYLRGVERLLTDLDPEERQTLLAELREQLDDISDDPNNRLGTPEEFVAEYRRSAGLGRASDNGVPGPKVSIATLVSSICLPFGVLILFSFGGQLILGPFALVIEWILARISPRPLRIAWSVLAGALTGEIVALVVDLYLTPVDTMTLIFIGGPVALVVGLLFYRTTTRGNV